MYICFSLGEMRQRMVVVTWLQGVGGKRRGCTSEKIARKASSSVSLSSTDSREAESGRGRMAGSGEWWKSQPTLENSRVDACRIDKNSRDPSSRPIRHNSAAPPPTYPPTHASISPPSSCLLVWVGERKTSRLT